MSLKPWVATFAWVAAFGGSQADPRLIDSEVLQAIAAETSGESAKRNLDRIALFHRTRAGSQFRAAAEHVLATLSAYGFENARILEYPADGRTMFGTQKARPAWDVETAELWELDADGTRVRRLAHWASMPLTVAQDSLSGAATTTLVDIGAGTDDADYQGKDIAGKLVLTESQPGAVADLAVGRYGAVGIVSYAPNQRSAWWKEDDRLIRWGHLSSFPAPESRTFAFMISLGEARAFQSRLRAGETVHLQASIDARQEPGVYSLVEAYIEGSDPKVGDEQIVFSCHLDHPRPGANDNASGCVAILEAARTLKTLISQGRIRAPRRSIRFVWPAEIEGTLIYLVSHPELPRRMKANIHLDMVGGNANTKAVYRISGGPYSLPHFISDVGHAIGRFVNAETLAYAGGEDATYPLVAQEGGKEPLLAVMEGISIGSDHDIYREGSWRIPGVYLHDWPDRYIHTNFDIPANIDPTKLKRSAFIGAAVGWYLARLDATDVPQVLAMLREDALRRAGDLLARRSAASPDNAAAITRVHWIHERRKLASVKEFAPVNDDAMNKAVAFIDALARQLGGAGGEADVEAPYDRVYARNPELRGPMRAFGYSYLEDKLSPEAYQALPLNGVRAYEALNLVDGRRSVAEINAWMLAEFGASKKEDVLAYLEVLESIDVIRREER